MDVKLERMPPPAKIGAHGCAWRCDIEAFRRNLGAKQENDATLASWIVEARWAHPLWHSYSVILVHLRPLADGTATLLYRPDATHEFWIYALDPEHPRAPAVIGTETARFLTPINFAAQLAEPSDEAACTKLEGAIDLIIAGELNPDTDAQRQWEALFGNAMIKPEWRATRG